MPSLTNGIKAAFTFHSSHQPIEIHQKPIPFLESVLLILICIVLMAVYTIKVCNYYRNATSKNLTYYLQMRNPKCNFIYYLGLYTFYIYTLLGCAFPHTIGFSIWIISIIMTLWISFLTYTCYLLYFSHLHQQLVVGNLQQQNDGLFQRFGHFISYLMAQRKFQHENGCLFIMIIYNTLFIGLSMLFKSLSYSIFYYIFFVIFPQILILNLLIITMKCKSSYSLTASTSEFADIFHLRSQLKLTVISVILPLNLLFLAIWVFPQYSRAILSPALLYEFTMFMYSISSYPVNIQLKQARKTAIKMQQSETWQDFLCEQSLTERRNRFQQIFDNKEDVGEILDEINASFSDKWVSQQKLNLFLMHFAYDPKKNPNMACLHEFLFVTEIMQIKQCIAKKYSHGLLIESYGTIIDIPNGLPPSPFWDQLSSQEDITAKDLYEVFISVYQRYIHDKTATIPLYNIKDIETIYHIWDCLVNEYPKKLCLDECNTDQHGDNDSYNELDKDIQDLDFKIDPNRFINYDFTEHMDDMDDLPDVTYDHQYTQSEFNHTHVIDAFASKFNSNLESVKSTTTKPSLLGEEMDNLTFNTSGFTFDNTTFDNDYKLDMDMDINVDLDINLDFTQNENAFDFKPSELTLLPTTVSTSVEQQNDKSDSPKLQIEMSMSNKYYPTLDEQQIYEIIGCYDELLESSASRIEKAYGIYKKRQVRKMRMDGCKAAMLPCHANNDK